MNDDTHRGDRMGSTVKQIELSNLIVKHVVHQCSDLHDVHRDSCSTVLDILLGFHDDWTDISLGTV